MSKSDPVKQLRNRILQTQPLKVILGAGDQKYPIDWICTNIEELDVANKDDWYFLFSDSYIDYLFAEHVLEHLTEEQAILCARNALIALKPGATFRIAVPDGNFPDAEYIDRVKPGGSGAGAKDHKILWTYQSLVKVFQDAGYDVKLLEFWDSGGRFHYTPWTEDAGKVLRSLYNDERNETGSGSHTIRYTSIIIDAIKPFPVPAPESVEMEGVMKTIKRRDIEGVQYFDVDDFIRIIQTTIELNEGELKEALLGKKIYYMKLCAQMEDSTFERFGKYSDEKILPIEETLTKLAEEIIEFGEDSVVAGANKIFIDLLIQLKEARDPFSDN